MGLGDSGIQGSFNQVSAVFDKTIGAVIKAPERHKLRNQAGRCAQSLRLEVEQYSRLSKYASHFRKTTVHEDDMLRVQMAQPRTLLSWDVSQLSALQSAIGLSQALGIDLGTSMI
jgi:hypothetical protein